MTLRQELKTWFKNIPNLYRNSFRKKWVKALQGKSMRAAVDAKCSDCMCWQNVEIKRCNIITCPLWAFRPYADKNSDLAKEVVHIVTEIDSCK